MRENFLYLLKSLLKVLKKVKFTSDYKTFISITRFCVFSRLLLCVLHLVEYRSQKLLFAMKNRRFVYNRCDSEAYSSLKAMRRSQNRRSRQSLRRRHPSCAMSSAEFRSFFSIKAHHKWLAFALRICFHINIIVDAKEKFKYLLIIFGPMFRKTIDNDCNHCSDCRTATTAQLFGITTGHIPDARRPPHRRTFLI